MKRNKGFTLVEMLVVIAIIAVLVSIIIPVVGNSTAKAKAAADAANLRSVLGLLNTEVAATGKTLQESTSSITPPESTMYPGAALHILFTDPGFIEVYYVVGSDYYGLEYYAEYAQTGSSSISTDKSTTPGDWYIAGTGQAG